MQGEVVGDGVNFFQLGQADSLLFCHRSRNKGIVGDDFHPESSRPPRHFHADSPQTHDTQSFAPQFGALQRFLLPLPGVHELVRPSDVARHGEHERQRVLGHGDGIGTGSIHHCDALARGSIQINVVDAHAGAPDDPQFAGMFQQIGVHLHRRANDKRVSRLQMRRQLALHLVRCDDSPTRLAQQVDCRGRNLFRHYNFHS